MALSAKIKHDLKGKIEPRPQGTITPTGLLKVAEGTVMCRRKEELPRSDEQIEAAEEQFAAMEQAFQQQQENQQQQEAPTVNATKKRSRKKQQQVQTTVSATINVIGLGSVPSQYAYVCMGENGVAILGLTPMSFVPEATDVTKTPLTNVFTVSTFGDLKFVHMGNTVRLPNGINNLIIYAME